MKSNQKQNRSIQKAAVPNEETAAFFYSSKKYKIPDILTVRYDFFVLAENFLKKFCKKISKPEATFQVFSVELAVGSSHAEVRA